MRMAINNKVPKYWADLCYIIIRVGSELLVLKVMGILRASERGMGKYWSCAFLCPGAFDNHRKTAKSRGA